MKFSQLETGARFVLDGETYVKSGPMVATHAASGKSRMIPRYANILPEAGAALPAAPAGLTPEAAFDEFYGCCREMIKGLSGEVSSESLARVEAELIKARERYLAALPRKE